MLPQSKNTKDDTMDNQQGKTYQAEVETMAYVLGAFQGDGYYKYHYYGNGGWYMIEISKGDKEVIERCQFIIKSVFDTPYSLLSRKINSGLTIWTLRTSKKVIYDFITIATGFKTMVPHAIISGSRDSQLNYISGIFDTDGSVAVSDNRFQLKYSSTELKVIESVALLLQRLGVKVGKIGSYDKGGYKTVYNIQPNIRSFIDAGCVFYNYKKAARVKAYIDGFASETLYTESVTTD